MLIFCSRISACGNSFCQDCVASLRSCPKCRGEAPEWTPACRALHNMANRTRVKCDSCDKAMLREEFQHHSLNECTLPCPYQCGRLVVRAQWEKHREECTACVVICPALDLGCFHSCRAAELAHHTAVCGFAILKPTIICLRKDKEEMQRRLLEKLRCMRALKEDLARVRLEKDQSQHAFEDECQKVALLKKKAEEDQETIRRTNQLYQQECSESSRLRQELNQARQHCQEVINLNTNLQNSSTSDSRPGASSRRVYVTNSCDTRGRYHYTRGCYNADSSITLNSAMQEGREPCDYCV
mgnify:CR=1 FL=1